MDDKKLEALAKELAKDIKSEKDLSALSRRLVKLTVETALNAEIEDHLGYPKNNPDGRKTDNSRNGFTPKTLKGNFGHLEMETPRDRNGTFDPQFVKKGQTRLTEFDDQILALYAKGMTTRDIVAAFKEMYDAKDMKQVAAGLKSIYNSPTLAGAEKALDDFSERWDEKYPAISKSWRSHWDNLITIFDYPNEIRRIIYTTNAIESLNSVIRKAIKNRKIFPSDKSACKIIYLAVMSASKRWTMPLRNWKPAMNRFAIEFEGRFPV